MENEKISVVVPVYKVEAYLSKCINSIINQTYKNLEIILVDDGSPDRCGEICDDFSKKDERIKVIHQDNEGLSGARNSGYRISTGKYIMFIDSDDWLNLDMIEFLYEKIKEHDADVAICGFRIVDEDGNIVSSVHDDGSEILVDSKEAVRLVVKDKKINSFTWDKLYRRNLWEDISFPRGRYTQDMFVMYKVLEKAGSTIIANVPKYNYLQRSTSIQGSRGHKNDLDQFDMYVEQEKYLISRYPDLSDVLYEHIAVFGIGIYQRFSADDKLTETEKEGKQRIRNNLIAYAGKIKTLGNRKYNLHLFMIKYFDPLYRRYSKLKVR